MMMVSKLSVIDLVEVAIGARGKTPPHDGGGKGCHNHWTKYVREESPMSHMPRAAQYLQRILAAMVWPSRRGGHGRAPARDTPRRPSPRHYAFPPPARPSTRPRGS